MYKSHQQADSFSIVFTKYDDSVSYVVVPGYRLSLRVASEQGQTFCLQDLELVTARSVLQGPVHAENNLEITKLFFDACV